jgi:hypothetical protein
MLAICLHSLHIMQYMNAYVWNIACRSVSIIPQTLEQMSVRYDLKESEQVIWSGQANLVWVSSSQVRLYCTKKAL